MANAFTDDYRQPPPRGRNDYGPAPYPEEPMDYDPRGRPPGAEHLPPPPIGDTLRPALKRVGSQSRLSPDTRPQFPDEASYLGKNAPDLEAKTRPKHREFRDMRDGYESDEGEMHRQMANGRGGGGRRARRGDEGPPTRGPLPRDNDTREQPSRRPRPRDYPPDDAAQLSHRPPRDDPYDDDERPPPRRKSRNTHYDDDGDDYDEQRPRRRSSRPPPDVEYGSDPIPARRRSDRRPQRARDYDEYDEEDDYRPPRRRRSFDDHRRGPRRDDDPYLSDDREHPRRRRRDQYDEYDDRDRRRDRSRRRRGDDEDDYDRRDRRRDRNRPPPEIKIGKYDVGPYVQKGQKHWGTIAPIVTPLVLSMARKYFSGGGGKR